MKNYNRSTRLATIASLAAAGAILTACGAQEQHVSADTLSAPTAAPHSQPSTESQLNTQSQMPVAPELAVTQDQLTTAAKQGAVEIAKAAVAAQANNASGLTFSSTYNGDTLTIGGKSDSEFESVVFTVGIQGREELSAFHLGPLTGAEYEEVATLLASPETPGIMVEQAEAGEGSNGGAWVVVPKSAQCPEGVEVGNTTPDAGSTPDIQWLPEEGAVLDNRAQG